MPLAPRALKFRTVGAPIAVRTLGQLDFALEKLTTRSARQGPILVELYVPDAGYMRMGIGLSKSVLSFRPTDTGNGKKKAASHAVSHKPGGDAEKIVYWTWCEDHRHGYDGTNLIRVDLATKALSHFFKTGELDPDVQWKEFTPGVA